MTGAPTIPHADDPRSISHLDASDRISRLSHRPNYLLDAVITIPSSELPTRESITYLPANNGHGNNGHGNNRHGRHGTSAQSLFSLLPPEIALRLLDTLDVQSLVRLSSTCSRANLLVKTLSPYRDLIAYAPETLVALRKQGLLHLHSIHDLALTLRTQRCATCPAYGAYLFLPTCRRCCWQCQRHHPSLRLVRTTDAQRYFGLSKGAVARLPVVNIIPGRYGVCGDPPPTGKKKKFELVSAEAAKRLALQIYKGNVDRISSIAATRCRRSAVAIDASQFFQRVYPTDRDSIFLGVGERTGPQDDWFGMASVSFPSLDGSGTIEHGLWCRGCSLARNLYDMRRLPDIAVTSTVPANVGPIMSFLALERKAWSRAEFLSHVEKCHGVKELVASSHTSSD